MDTATPVQLNLFEAQIGQPVQPGLIQLPSGSWLDINVYDRFVIFFSGGKDSLASLLSLLDAGIPPDRIELWHHCVDGDPQKHRHFMDWPVTPAYCRAVADALGVPLFLSWRDGGFEREMLRENQRTAPVFFETPGGAVFQVGGINGPLGTRRKFPQVSANLQVRYCSPALKIDVGSAALRNQERFWQSRTLTLSGERAEESAARSHYPALAQDYADNRSGGKGRLIDRWRPVHAWTEAVIWGLIRKYRVNPHPAYHLGFGRTSCQTCIFLSKNGWASARKICPAGFDRLANYEEEFGVTIQRKMSIRQLADMGVPYASVGDDLVEMAMSTTYTEPVFLEEWQLPAGAFGENSGPS